VGCSAEKCEKPLVKIGNKCCVDLNDNQICDVDEGTETETKTEEKQEIITVEPKQTQEQTEQVEEKTQEKPEDKLEETDLETKEESEEEIPPSKTQYLLDLYTAKQPGYKYICNKEWHKVKDDKIKIELNLPKKYTFVEVKGIRYSVFYIDTVYLDRNTLQAIGYCEQDATCTSGGLLDIPIYVDYNEFKDKTPDEWLKEYAPIEPIAYEANKYYIKGKLTTRATYEIEDGEIRIYYKPRTGLVMRIETQIGEYPTDIIEYFDLTAGTIRDIDVIHRSKSEIPPEETFYSTRS
jgi:hypothetical protein